MSALATLPNRIVMIEDNQENTWDTYPNKLPKYLDYLQTSNKLDVLSNHAIWPLSATTTGFAVLPLCEPTASIFLTTSIPSTTLPNTTCFPSNQSVLTVHKKNCEPFVFGPALAIERIPGPVSH